RVRRILCGKESHGKQKQCHKVEQFHRRPLCDLENGTSYYTVPFLPLLPRKIRIASQLHSRRRRWLPQGVTFRESVRSRTPDRPHSHASISTEDVRMKRNWVSHLLIFC